jgi:hypothetical protein
MLLPDRTRVILVGLPRLLEEIVAAAIVAEDDLVLIGSFGAASNFSNGSLEADVAVTGEHVADAVTALLRQAPRIKILSLASDGKSAWLYELQPVLLPLGELSPAGLVAALRRAAHPVHAGQEA